MQFQSAQANGGGVTGAIAPPLTPVATIPTTKEIPYDYVAKFALQGNRGNRVQDVINISVEGAFVAVSIGYSFIPTPLPIKTPDGGTGADSGGAPEPVGIRALASSESNLFLSLIEPFKLDQQTQQLELLKLISECTIHRLCGIHFKYSIVDSGSGRELQNQPIHNIAGLGESSGERPFRPLAKPMVFLPRSTVRIEIEEISEGPIYRGAELYMVLHGYKMLGYGTGLP